MSFFKKLFSKKKEKLNDALFTTKKSFVSKLSTFFTGKIDVFDDFVEELEELLIQSDIAIDTTFDILDELKQVCEKQKLKDKSLIYEELKKILANLFSFMNEPWDLEKEVNTKKPYVALIVGVNGVGKTTTIAKLTQTIKHLNKSVVLGAADTFRAAAIEQLNLWAERLKTPIIKHHHGSDPGAVAYNTIQYTLSKNIDVVFIDTAGRLHNKTPLMDELSKVHRVTKKALGDIEPEVWLVIDGTTGQNGIEQAKKFSQICPLSGIIITKLDGTSKGGILFSIAHKLQIPIRFVGVGEKAEDLIPFSANDFIESLFDTPIETK